MESPASAHYPIAYSYIRFSTPDQAKGDSLRRQAEDAAAWCGRNGVRLDTATSFRDVGKSAFTGTHRTNPDRHALAAFLKLVEQGKVPRGSYLIIENLDRLSREHLQPALLLALNLLQAGIRLVQLKPVEMVFDSKSDTLPVMMMIVELSRGHSESAMKSERIGAAWREKRRKAREGGAVLTRRLPAWVEEQDGKLCLVPEKAAAVRRVFELAAAGYGCTLILKKLVAEGVPAIGDSGKWARSYVGLLLADRRVLGEFQPCLRDGTPDGEALPGYYPAAVTEALWLAARAGAAQRRDHPGRVRRGSGLNVFAGLLRDARGGGRYQLITRVGRAKSPRRGVRHAVLVTTASTTAGAECFSFPFRSFERAVLSLLAEVDPREVLDGARGPDETQILAGEQARLETSIAVIGADMDEHGESPALLQRLRRKEAELRAVVEKLAEARRQAANPLSESWGEFGTLARALDAAPDPEDARLRLRSVLRNIVASVWLLVVPRGRDRLCAAQVWFAGSDRRRDYLILDRPARSNQTVRRKAEWWAWSLADVVNPGDLDLRNRADAAKLEAALLALDPEELPGRMTAGDEEE
jgi:DNA invertase Pin-like site-specific DNA recombinase